MKRLCIAQIKYQYDPMSLAIKVPGNISEPFLPGSVPHLKFNSSFHSLLPIPHALLDRLHRGGIRLVIHLDIYFLDFEIYAHGRDVAESELVLGEAGHQTGLPRVRVTQNDQLDQVLLGIRTSRYGR